MKKQLFLLTPFVLALGSIFMLANLSQALTTTDQIKHKQMLLADPVAQPDVYTTTEEINLTISSLDDGLLGNDTDADGDTLTVITDTNPTSGTLYLNTTIQPWQSTFTGTQYSGYSPDITTINGQPSIVHLTSTGLRHTAYNGTNWISSTIDPEGVFFPTIAEINNQPVVAYYQKYQDFPNGDEGIYVIYAYHDGNQWINEVVVDIFNDGSFFGNFSASISLAQINGQPAIAYLSDYGLEIARHNGVSWSTEIVDPIEAHIDSGLQISLAEIDGQPMISYPDVINDDLKLARYINGEWQTEVLVSEGVNTGQHSTLVEYNRHPVIAYNGTGSSSQGRRLNVIAYNGTTWENILLDEEVDSLDMVEINGQLAISYIRGYGALQNELKYAWLDGTQWFSETVNIGYMSHEALIDVNNEPMIAYYGRPTYSGAGQLKVTQRPLGQTTGTFTYQPNWDFCGTDSFTYHANDGVNNSNITTATVHVTCVPDAPVAIADAYTVTEDNTLSVTAIANGVLQNDYDVDGDSLIVLTETNPVSGSLTFNSDGTFVYTPAEHVCGTDSFTYIANDGALDSNSATVTINIQCINDAPIAVNDVYTVTQGMTLTVDLVSEGLIGNDTDLDNDPLAVLTVTNPTSGTLIMHPQGIWNTTTINENQTGISVNNALVIVNDQPSLAYVDYQTSLSYTVMYSWYDGSQWNHDAISRERYTSEASIAVIDGQPAIAYGTFSLNGTESIIYARFNGSEWVYQTIETTDNISAIGDLTLVNGQPTIAYEKYSDSSSPAFLMLAQYDGSSWNKQTLVQFTNPLYSNPKIAEINGQLTIVYKYYGNLVYGYYNGSQWLFETITTTVAGSIIQLIEWNGRPAISYYDDDEILKIAQYNGTEWIFTSVDNLDLLYGYHSFKLLNDQPSFSYGIDGHLHFSWYDGYGWWSERVDEEGSEAVYPLHTIWEGKPIILYSMHRDSQGYYDIVKFAELERFVFNGTFTYQPNWDFCGTDSFDYYANDGELDSNIATVTINVLCPDAPIAVPDAYTTTEETPLTVNTFEEGVLGNDIEGDGDGSLTAVLTLSPTLGTLNFETNGTFTYTPDNNICGTDSFNYYATDGVLNSDVTTATITVECTNNAPITVPDMYTVTQGMTLTINLVSEGLLANDSDPEQDTITVSGNDFPTNGTLVNLNADGTFTYLADGFCGTDSFTYTATDGELVSEQTAVTINVICQTEESYTIYLPVIQK